jgi:hypothetical protein
MIMRDYPKPINKGAIYAEFTDVSVYTDSVALPVVSFCFPEEARYRVKADQRRPRRGPYVTNGNNELVEIEPEDVARFEAKARLLCEKLGVKPLHFFVGETGTFETINGLCVPTHLE